jgi:hypothetical protein
MGYGYMLTNLFSSVNGTFHKIVRSQRSSVRRFVGKFTKVNFFSLYFVISFTRMGKVSPNPAKLMPGCHGSAAENGDGRLAVAG